MSHVPLFFEKRYPQFFETSLIWSAKARGARNLLFAVDSDPLWHSIRGRYGHLKIRLLMVQLNPYMHTVVVKLRIITLVPTRK